MSPKEVNRNVDADVDGKLGVVMEGLPHQQEVGVHVEPGLHIGRLEQSVQRSSSHDGVRNERVIAATLDRKLGTNRPVESHPRHLRVIAGHFKVRMISAERDYKFALVLAFQPTGESKPTRQVTITRKNIRVIC